MMILIRAAGVVLASILGTTPVLAAAVEQPSYVYPQERAYGVHKGILHAPQVKAWPDFARFEGVMAMQFFPDGGKKELLAAITISGKTEVDLGRRLVYVTELSVESVKFTGQNTEDYEGAVRDGVRKGRLEVPLDVFLLGLDDSILDRPLPEGFSMAVPDILVSKTPAIVLFINGKSVLADLPGTGLKLVVNANWPLVTDARSSIFYLLDREVWQTAKKLSGPWKTTRKLPKGLSRLAKEGDHAMIAAAVPAPQTKQPASTVNYRERPTDLVVMQGEARLEEIPGTGGLSWVANTDSALLKLESTWYYLTAGRWFSTADPFKGPWQFVEVLPEAFSAIPDDHEIAYVRTAIRGTPEAKVAALESLLPKRKSVAMDTKPAIEVSYAGKPQFQPIENTAVSRAENTGYDVILFGNTYYLCYAGVWYTAVAPTGPWAIASSVPKEIYAIPPNSPSYQVTQVTVVESTPTTIVYSQTPAYSSSVYVVYGVPWYGTGYYYYPYIWDDYYYPYPIAYGHGSYYNPVTGGYGSRSVWYGPYGGYSYAQGYNPRTGRYGHVETAWDGDEWASSGETYNPRTGVASQTSRYYDEDSNKSEMDRTVQRGDEWVETDRRTDFDDRTSTTTRGTSRGGSSEITHSGDGSGNRTTSGTIESGDGRTATVEGSGQRGQGSTTVTGSEGGSATTNRDGTTTRTDFETASGGQGTSISQGQGRTTVAQSAAGDLYAGRNGNVFKKSDDGWQSYNQDSGDWSDVESRPDRAEGDKAALQRSATRDGVQSDRAALERSQSQDRLQSDRAALERSQRAKASVQSDRSSRSSYGGNDFSQLDRDANARSRGMSSFDRNRSGAYGGGFNRGGGFKRGGGGRGRR